MTKERASEIFDVFIKHRFDKEGNKAFFVSSFSREEYPIKEYYFSISQPGISFGNKYDSNLNMVVCYSDANQTSKSLVLIEIINAELILLNKAK